MSPIPTQCCALFVSVRVLEYPVRGTGLSHDGVNQYHLYTRVALPRYTDTVKEFGERECTTVGVHSYRSYRFQERIAYCRLERMKEYACEGCDSEGRRQDMVSLRHPRRLFNILA